jgi:hypothetical protein
MFNYVLDRIIEQGRPSVHASGACVYTMTGQDGGECHCAAGWIIPPVVYTKMVEAKKGGTNLNSASFGQLLRHTRGVWPVLSHEHREFDMPQFEGFIVRLQEAHDEAANEIISDRDFLTRYIHHMIKVADTYKLDAAGCVYYVSKLWITTTVE